MSLLDIRNLTVAYGPRTVLRGVDLTVRSGEVVALVGESGSGKTTLAHAVVGLLPRGGRITGGQVRLDGIDLTGLGERSLRAVRGARIGFVPQDPGVALNPLRRVGDQVAEALVVHSAAPSGGRRALRERAVALLSEAGLPDAAAQARRHPHELSGGMRQRVLIAAALACRPPLVIADEPTSALDVTVQRRVLDHVGALTRGLGTAVLLVTHDLALAAERADRVLVMSDGVLVEEGPASMFAPTRPRAVVGPGPTVDTGTVPRHPYTRRLVAASPAYAPDRPERPAPARTLLAATGLRREYGSTVALSDVDLTVGIGETVGLVGESGSGKSTTARLVARLERADSGRIVLDGADVTAARGTTLRAVRRRVQVVHQNPYGALDPRWRIGPIVAEPLRAFGIGDRAARRNRVAELLDQVALPADVARRRPTELSGGQRQRVAIARALALRPDLVICDEPVSALDVSVQAQILDLLDELQRELGLAYLFISHDLSVVRRVCDRIVVLRAGRVVETGPTTRVFHHPTHPYTRELLAAVPGAAA
ncbi:dipeptide ABC transporter ATP-binding protein [Actinocatenispora rupis]|uniref:Peptide ABC transporter ATP-binding protein n=1 Tax=Actinocatenispora rupis TaxID=519421 RepID=A0A8J3NB03_9ACTN|nr:ABC transporter ATP-binding protein [Actinocatenispora rupis]GID10117.1 peptide ABC transporter ATP-binding protein [Actinocatenispora rupis]